MEAGAGIEIAPKTPRFQHQLGKPSGDSGFSTSPTEHSCWVFRIKGRREEFRNLDLVEVWKTPWLPHRPGPPLLSNEVRAAFPTTSKELKK